MKQPNKILKGGFVFLWIGFLAACQQDLKLSAVSYAEFEQFIQETGYVTDAERYGWSIVQLDVYNYTKVDSANWRKPDGQQAPASKDLPVTQVSYNDAMAYCAWAKTKLPSYEEYWDLVQADQRQVVSDNLLPISPVEQYNVLGNVWDVTATQKEKPVRLAGGSVFCSPSTCDGTVKERALFVDRETGNIHIGFAVVK